MVYTSVQEDPLLEYGRQALPDGLAQENRGPSAFVYRGLDRGLVSEGSRTGGSQVPPGPLWPCIFPKVPPQTGSCGQALADRLSPTGSSTHSLTYKALDEGGGQPCSRTDRNAWIVSSALPLRSPRCPFCTLYLQLTGARCKMHRLFRGGSAA